MTTVIKPKDILSDLIKIDSQCTKSNKEIIDYLAQKLSKYECKIFDFTRDGLNLYNLIVKIPGETSKDPLIFIGHTDTVPGSENWKNLEFFPVEKNERLYGLGSSDMKAGISCILSAVLSLNKKPSTDVYLIFDADEEDEGQGAREVLKNFSVNKARVIVAEPTDRKITYAHKGCLDLIIKTVGIAQHSSLATSETNKSQNAIYKANSILNELIKYGQEIEKNEDSVLGKATLNIGRIEGGTSANVVADKCIFKICRRILPNEDINEVYNSIVKLVKLVDSNAMLRPTFWAPSFLGNKEGQLMKEILSVSQAQGLNLKLQVKAATTEAGIFNKFGDTLVFGPGSMDLAHQPNEYVSISDLEIFRKIYLDIMNI